MQSRFEVKKRKILEQLEAPDEKYQDLSPKGSIDEPIRSLIGNINNLNGLVTTSSCSGRISVYLEGRKKDFECTELALDSNSPRAGPGGKGGGGSWLFISHFPIQSPQDVPVSHFTSMFDLQNLNTEDKDIPSTDCRYIHLKFEPMVCIINQRLDEG